MAKAILFDIENTLLCPEVPAVQRFAALRLHGEPLFTETTAREAVRQAELWTARQILHELETGTRMDDAQFFRNVCAVYRAAAAQQGAEVDGAIEAALTGRTHWRPAPGVHALLSALGVALIRVYDPYRRMTAALNRTHEVENVQQAAEQVEKIVATSLNRKREDALRLWINGQPSEEGLVRFPAVPILLEMSPDERLRGLLAQETPDCVVCAVGEASLALCAPADGQSAVDICLHLATQMHCRCYYGLPIQSPSELPARYQALLERKKLRFFYPGQQVFAQTAAESAGKNAEELETALNTCFNAAKTGKEIAFGKLMEQLKGENYENVLFTLKRLDHLLDSALPGDSAARPTLEKLLAAAQTPEDVSARFEPRLEKLLSQQKAQKHNRTQEIVIQINQRLEQGFRDTSIGAQSIAEEMGVSAAYLRKQYLTEAGISIGDKLNQLRVDEASRLLLETDQPIESVARQIGVENTKYFFVLFKKFKGMTPRQFRCKAETSLL